MDTAHRFAATLGRYARGMLLLALFLVTFACVFLIGYTVARAFTDFFPSLGRHRVDGVLLYIVPTMLAMSLASRLCMWLDDRTWTLRAPTVTKVLAVVFAVAAVLYAVRACSPTREASVGAHEPMSMPAEAVSVPEPLGTATESEQAIIAERTALKATPLSVDLPGDLTVPNEAISDIVEREFTVPADTDAVTDPESVPSSIDNPFVRDTLGLVRAGMDGVGLCESSVACPAIVRFRLTVWEARWEPVPGNTWGLKRQTAKDLVLIQATFTTASTWNEFLYAKFDGEEWGWRKTTVGWQSIGALSYAPQARAKDAPQYHPPKVNEKAKQVFYKLLACTYNAESRCNAR